MDSNFTGKNSLKVWLCPGGIKFIGVTSAVPSAKRF